MATFMEGLIDALGKLGMLADLPFSSVRDWVAGEDPFDQWYSDWMEDAGNRFEGRDVLRKWGWIKPEDTLGNFWGGLAAEMALDPTIWASLGTSAMAKAGLKRAGVAASTRKAAQEAAETAARNQARKVPETAEALIEMMLERDAPLQHSAPVKYGGRAPLPTVDEVAGKIADLDDANTLLGRDAPLQHSAPVQYGERAALPRGGVGDDYIRFDKSPGSKVLAKLKEDGFKWDKRRKVWAAPANLRGREVLAKYVQSSALTPREAIRQAAGLGDASTLPGQPSSTVDELAGQIADLDDASALPGQPPSTALRRGGVGDDYIRFDRSPGPKVRAKLKEDGFKWDKRRKVWAAPENLRGREVLAKYVQSSALTPRQAIRQAAGLDDTNALLGQPSSTVDELAGQIADLDDASTLPGQPPPAALPNLGYDEMGEFAHRQASTGPAPPPPGQRFVEPSRHASPAELAIEGLPVKGGRLVNVKNPLYLDEPVTAEGLRKALRITDDTSNVEWRHSQAVRQTKGHKKSVSGKQAYGPKTYIALDKATGNPVGYYARYLGGASLDRAKALESFAKVGVTGEGLIDAVPGLSMDPMFNRFGATKALTRQQKLLVNRVEKKQGGKLADALRELLTNRSERPAALRAEIVEKLGSTDKDILEQLRILPANELCGYKKSQLLQKAKWVPDTNSPGRYKLISERKEDLGFRLASNQGDTWRIFHLEGSTKTPIMDEFLPPVELTQKQLTDFGRQVVSSGEATDEFVSTLLQRDRSPELSRTQDWAHRYLVYGNANDADRMTAMIKGARNKDSEWVIHRLDTGEPVLAGETLLTKDIGGKIGKAKDLNYVKLPPIGPLQPGEITYRSLIDVMNDKSRGPVGAMRHAQQTANKALKGDVNIERFAKHLGHDAVIQSDRAGHIAALQTGELPEGGAVGGLSKFISSELTGKPPTMATPSPESLAEQIIKAARVGAGDPASASTSSVADNLAAQIADLVETPSPRKMTEAEIRAAADEGKAAMDALATGQGATSPAMPRKQAIEVPGATSPAMPRKQAIEVPGATSPAMPRKQAIEVPGATSPAGATSPSPSWASSGILEEARARGIPEDVAMAMDKNGLTLATWSQMMPDARQAWAIENGLKWRPSVTAGAGDPAIGKGSPMYEAVMGQLGRSIEKIKEVPTIPPSPDERWGEPVRTMWNRFRGQGPSMPRGEYYQKLGKRYRGAQGGMRGIRSMKDDPPPPPLAPADAASKMLEIYRTSGDPQAMMDWVMPQAKKNGLEWGIDVFETALSGLER